VTVEKPAVETIAKPVVAETAPKIVEAKVVAEAPILTEVKLETLAAKPVVEKPAESAAPAAVEKPAVETVAKPVAASRTFAGEKRTDGVKDETVATAAQTVSVSAPTVMDVPLRVDDMSAASARTIEVLAAVEEIVEAVSAQIEVTPSLVKGEGEVVIRLKPAVLDGSEIKLSAKDNVFSVMIAPATPQAAQIATAGVPQLERALAEHMPAFGMVTVAVAKKGKPDENK